MMVVMTVMVMSCRVGGRYDSGHESAKDERAKNCFDFQNYLPEKRKHSSALKVVLAISASYRSRGL